MDEFNYFLWYFNNIYISIKEKSPDDCATTKQVCRDELVVYLFFPLHNIYTQRYFYVLSTVSRKSNFATYISIIYKLLIISKIL